jgi:hypothetical protein
MISARTPVSASSKSESVSLPPKRIEDLKPGKSAFAVVIRGDAFAQMFRGDRSFAKM